jgi:hypothetical protein
MKYIERTLNALALVAACMATDAARADEPIDFSRDVRPILSDKCFFCHGPDPTHREADLRLDLFSETDGVRGAEDVIVLGHPEESLLLERVCAEDEADRMPPTDSGKELTPEQTETLKRWIAEGVEYQPHWSLIPPERPELPAVKDVAWSRNPIDRFVLARLDEEGLTPSGEADRRVLIRRLSLDLLGLPPSAEEVHAFVADGSSDAYERLVDRLLASSHFGERMALDWLDAARYADTNGYSIDGGRQMWLWRDWVIDSFNRNRPYDEFLIEQLAGDLLPKPSDAQRTATGFARNNMVTHEGGTIPEENLTNYNVDRVKTLGESVLGLTLACAQCHDHKFDPITQRDYYQLYAYFNSLADIGLDGNGGINPQPFMEARTVLETGEVKELEREITALSKELAHPEAKQIAAWEMEQREKLINRGINLQLLPVELLQVSSPLRGAGFGIEDGRVVRVTEPDDLVAYDVSMRLPENAAPITGMRLVFYPDTTTPGGGRGFGESSALGMKSDESKCGTFVVTSLSASSDVVPSDQVNLNRMMGLRNATANSWLPSFSPEGVLSTSSKDAWSPEIGSEAVRITITFDKPVIARESPFMTLQVNFGYGANLVGARFEPLAMTGSDDDSELPNDLIAILETPREKRSDEQQRLVANYFAEHSAAAWRQRVQLANLRERVATLTEKYPTMVMRESDTPRETRILNRGDYAQPTEKVVPGVPALLPPLPAGAPANRLGLAEWITMPEHPLTARVAVNRTWQLFFGAGIVRTPADFGAQGEYPTHPELLDWLAVDFRESGWDVKRMVKQVVMSAAYRQNSVPSAELLAKDPDNRLLARGPRFRLPAELIRDAALRTGGLLVPWVGGPSVNPYMPGDLWREVSHFGSSPATAQSFIQDHGEKLYRRTLYTYWKRSLPPPNMAAFDAPTRETCIVTRANTNTPLQALVMLNDVQFVEAARAFAERIVHQSNDDGDRIAWAFEECVSRPPTPQETVVVERVLSRACNRFESDEAAAATYLASGESTRDERIDPAEHAAWAQVAAMLLNLSEVVTRN